MDEIIHIGFWGLAAAYLLLVFPLLILLDRRVTIVRQTLISILRMTVQLLFVGFYLQVVFELNLVWLNLLWLVVMVSVADGSIVRGSGMRIRRFAGPLFLALLFGAGIPLLFFVWVILRRPLLLDAQYVIPIGGMILGNCLRADIIGLRNFYQSIRSSRKLYLQSLAQGAILPEAVGPYFRDALQAALIPTVASMATIGLVSLPGMMTGVILGGADPMTAIQYQIAIMIAIFSGTAITVYLAIWLTVRNSFDAYGILKPDTFAEEKKRR